MKHTKTHPSGRFEYRRVFPKHLRPFVSGQGGEPRREHKVSFGLEASTGFLGRYEAAAAEYAKAVAAAQRRHDGAYDNLDSAMIAWLAETFRAEMLEADEVERWDESGPELRRLVEADLKKRGIPFTSRKGLDERSEWADRARKRLEEELPFLKHLRATGQLDLIVHHWARDVFDLIDAQGKLFSPGPCR